jgi:hypothetical protein
MPYALCAMPYALCQIVTHVTYKGYSSIFDFFSNTQNFCVKSVSLQRLISTIPLGSSSFFQILQIGILSFFGFLGSQKKSKVVGTSRTRGDDFHSRCQSSSIIRRISTFLRPVFWANTDTADSALMKYTRQAIAVGKRHGAVSSIESYVPHLPKKCCNLRCMGSDISCSASKLGVA